MRIAILLILLTWAVIFGSFLLTCWAGGRFVQGAELQFWVGLGLACAHGGAIFVGQTLYEKGKQLWRCDRS